MPEPLVYLGGRMVPESQAALPIHDSGLVLGTAVSELTRTFRQRLFRLSDHLDRLYRSLEYVGVDIGLSQRELSDLSEELVIHNASLLGRDEELGLVHFITPGPYRTYAGLAAPRPTVCLHTFRLPFELWTGRMQHGARLVTPSIRHVPPQCCDPHIKCRSRMTYYLADRQARAADPEASALLLDLEGHVTETGAANFLMVRNGAIVSPPLRHMLPGISRMTALELAAQLGIAVVEHDFSETEAQQADEAFLTSTPYCIMPVSHINGVPLENSVPGPVTRRLQAEWSRLVGFDFVDQITGAATGRKD